MPKPIQRADDFEKRRKHLKNYNDAELKAYFWELAEKVVEPLIDLARTHTTPAIERSVLLRMGFSSLEAKGIVEKAIANNLISKGAGHVVFKYSRHTGKSIREAGLALLNDEGWDEVKQSFEVQHESK
ncbi:MAG TPA: ornithine aminomutase [Acholeplasmataceae bacterium]|jgi:D-ornithine 4,5-aminomutase subunit alpha|nr:ornithine aminomutase [Acholeplasmataceae bacterium]